MKTNFIYRFASKFSVIVMLLSPSFISNDAIAQCVNADFENCDFSGWTGTTSKNPNPPEIVCTCVLGGTYPNCDFGAEDCNGNNDPAYPDPFRYNGMYVGPNNNPSSSNDEYSHVIMTGGDDAIVGGDLSVLNPLRPNSCSARLGNAIAGAGGETISYRYMVTATSNSFTYDYAVVMRDPGTTHNGVTENYFKIRMWVYDSPTDSTLIDCATYNVRPSTSSDFINAGGNILYKPWSSVTIPLDAYVGREVRIQFLTSDCCPNCPNNPNGGSHWCYAYVDCACGELEIIPGVPVTCASSDYSPTLIAPVGAASYTWSGPSIVSGADQQEVTIDGPGTYSVDMTTFGQTLCIYTRTITVLPNLATPILSVSDTTICEGEPATLTVSGASTYDWSTGATTSSITESPTTTTSYTVIGTNGAGCRDTATTTITVNPNPIVTVNSEEICLSASATLLANGADTYAWSTGDSTNSITETPTTASTTYTVIGSSLGCSDTNTAVITTIAAPVVTVNSEIICEAQTATLTASGADNYSWSTGATTSSITEAPSVTTTYTVTGTTAGYTCPGIATGSITVNPLPIVFPENQTICNGKSATLTASGADSYSWSSGETTAVITKTPSITTVYTVTGTTQGCEGVVSGTVTVNPMPIVSAVSVQVCLNESATITAIGADSYVWSDGNTTNSITEELSTTTSYTVIGSSLGCEDTAIATITIIIPPVITVTSDTICEGELATITASGANDYTWSTSETTVSITDSPAITTTYSVSGVLSGFTCPANASGTILVNPLPEVDPPFATICDGETITITASGSDSYTWSSGEIGPTISKYPTETTTYTVTGTTLGCVGTAVSVITVNPVPVLTISSDTICFTESTTITVSGADSYNWANGGVGSSQLVTPVETSYYPVTGTSLGCSSSITGKVMVNFPPIVEVKTGPICVGDDVVLVAEGATSYTWTATSGAVSTTNPLQFNATNVGTITYTVQGDGCPNQTIVPSNVSPYPVVEVNDTTICGGKPATLTATGADSYSWSTGSDQNSIIVSPATTTTYSVTGVNLAGCPDSAVSIITANETPILTTVSDTVCPGGIGIISVESNVSTTFEWSTGETIDTISYQQFESETYKVTGWSLFGCPASSEASIIVTPVPIAEFQLDPSLTSIFETEIQFINKSSEDVVYWHWDFDNGETLEPNVANPIYTYESEVATYDIELIVHNSTPCYDTVNHSLVIGPEYSFYIPNVFTPNGDAFNEGFRGFGTGIEKYRLEIYDRWGDLIWYSDRLDEKWNGIANGGKYWTQQDVFVWKVFILDVFGIDHSYVGTVTIVR